MEKLQIGILSTASIAPRFIHAVQSSESCEAAALASRNLQKAQEKAADWGVPKACGSYKELLEDDSLDAIYIPVINDAHEYWARRALEAGYHVLCEKPCTLSAEETAGLFALAREKGRFFMEMNKVVFLPVIQEIRRRYQAGFFGEIPMADFTNWIDPSYNPWFGDLQHGGGPVYGHAIYSLELMQYLLGCYAKDWCCLCTGSLDRAENQTSMTIRMENGTLIANKTSTLARTRNTALLYGEKAWVEIPEYWKARRAVIHTAEGEEILEYPCKHELVYEVEHAAECIRKGLPESPVMTERMSVEAIRVLDAMQKNRGK